MEFSDFKIGQNDISRRLDKVIRVFADNLSLPEIYKGIRKGLIKVNKRKTKSDYRIQENDIISIASFLIKNSKTKENNIKISDHKMPEIVFENNHILIINKPYGINVHGDKDSLDKIIEEYYTLKKTNNSLSFKPGPLHRLDKNTTGLLAFSMSLEGARWFSENIKTHKIKKNYCGLIEGRLENEENWIDLISKDENQHSSFYTVTARHMDNNLKYDNADIDGKLAETTVSPLAWGKLDSKDVTLIKFAIKTGRKHQIRAQSALHKHPLAGDTAYGGTRLKYGNQEFYLTAKELFFPKENPINLPDKLSIPLPESFKNILKYCGIGKIDV